MKSSSVSVRFIVPQPISGDDLRVQDKGKIDFNIKRSSLPFLQSTIITSKLKTEQQNAERGDACL
jgi:hypothetical protein